MPQTVALGQVHHLSANIGIIPSFEQVLRNPLTVVVHQHYLELVENGVFLIVSEMNCIKLENIRPLLLGPNFTLNLLT